MSVLRAIVLGIVWLGFWYGLISLAVHAEARATETLKVNQRVLLNNGLLCATIEDLHEIVILQVTDSWAASKAVFDQKIAEKKCLLTPRIVVQVKRTFAEFVDAEFQDGTKRTIYTGLVVVETTKGLGLGYTVLNKPVAKPADISA